MNANEMFEVIGELYYRDTGKLRPGKDAAPGSYQEPLSPGNLTQFDEWCRYRLLDAALEQVNRLTRTIEQMKEGEW